MLNEDELGEVLRRGLNDVASEVEPSQDLWRRLDQIPGARPKRRGHRRLIPATALAAALGALVVVLGGGSRPTAALAFVVRGGPTVRLPISDIVAVTPANAKLMRLGRVRVVPMTASCGTPTGGFNYAKLTEHPTPRIYVANPSAPETTTLIVAAEHAAHGRVILALGTVGGAVPTCLSTHGTGPGLPGWMHQHPKRA